MKTTSHLAASLLALTCACALSPLNARAAQTPLPSAEIPPPGPPQEVRPLTPAEQDRLVRGLADGRPRLSGDVNNGYTAMCVDNTVSRSRSPLDACLYHGGVDHWFGAPAQRDSGTATG
ncbi:MAG TPA: hypothetical protein VGN52_13320 [Burkholderiales bacterium]